MAAKAAAGKQGEASRLPDHSPAAQSCLVKCSPGVQLRLDGGGLHCRVLHVMHWGHKVYDKWCMHEQPQGCAKVGAMCSSCQQCAMLRLRTAWHDWTDSAGSCLPATTNCTHRGDT